ncbi:MAG TPA: hypothetical protein VFB37_13180 [Steroidobacteraceae bacterium]|nr:hypothetical protein [Steroidobacteraceae bacterium]
MCARVKACNRKWLRRYVQALRENAAVESYITGLSADAVLVPIPPSDSATPAMLWSSHVLACALHHTGLGSSIWVGLRRHRAVTRSSKAWRWERPSVSEHFGSLQVDQPSVSLAQLVLIDDVITKGRTLMAAALRLHHAFPEARIAALALIRTVGFVEEIHRLVDPCEGEIRWNGRDAYRDP